METTIQGLGFSRLAMIDKPPPFKGLDIKIPIIIPIKGRGFINLGSGLDWGRLCHLHGITAA